MNERKPAPAKTGISIGTLLLLFFLLRNGARISRFLSAPAAPTPTPTTQRYGAPLQTAAPPTPTWTIVRTTPTPGGPPNVFATKSAGPSLTLTAIAWPKCIRWQDAGRYVGSHQCVCGTVTHTYDSDRAFFIDFTADETAYYAVSFDYTWNGLEGDCIQVCGVIESYQGRPETIIRDPDTQLFTCP